MAPTDTTAQDKIRKAVFGAQGLVQNIDNFSIESAVTHIVTTAVPKAGYMKPNATNDAVEPVTAAEITAGTPIKVAVPIQECRFEPGYGEIDRQMMTSFSATVEATAGTPKTIAGHLAGFLQKQPIHVILLRSCSN